MSKAYTQEEARQQFLDSVKDIVKYWSNSGGPCADRVEGCAFSILNLIDGTSMRLPRLDLVLRPHPDDKEYHMEEDEDYYEEGMVINDDAMLHELFYK